MSLEEDILIQKFLKNLLSKEEKENVLSRIEKDKSFEEKVNFEKQLILNLNHKEWSISNVKNHPEINEYEKLFRSQSTNQLRDTLRDINSEYQLKQKKKNRSWLLYSGIAVILIIIGITILSPSKISPDELYTNYLNLSELPSLVDRGNSEQALLIKAQKLFEAKKYNQSLNILEKKLSTYQKNKATIYLYTGISNMELGQFDKAEANFNTLIESKLIDSPKGMWYKALLFLKQNKTKKAVELLSQIIQSSDNYKYREASEILEQL